MKYLIILISLMLLGCNPLCPCEQKELSPSPTFDSDIIWKAFCWRGTKYVVTNCSESSDACYLVDLSAPVIGVHTTVSVGEARAYLKYGDKECP